MRVQQSTVEQVRNKLKMYKEKEKEMKEGDKKIDFKRNIIFFIFFVLNIFSLFFDFFKI